MTEQNWSNAAGEVKNELRHLGTEQARLATQQENIAKCLHNLSTQFAALRVDMKWRSGIWGALAGMAPALGVLIYFLLKHVGL